MARGLYVRDGEMEVQSRTAVWAGIPTSSDGASVSGPSGAAGPVGFDDDSVETLCVEVGQ